MTKEFILSLLRTNPACGQSGDWTQGLQIQCYNCCGILHAKKTLKTYKQTKTKDKKKSTA